MLVSNKKDITTETIDEVIVSKDFDNLTLNAIKSIRNNKNAQIVPSFIIK